LQLTNAEHFLFTIDGRENYIDPEYLHTNNNYYNIRCRPICNHV